MRLTCIICTLLLVFTALCGAAYAFTGFNALLLFCFGNATALRAVLAVNGVAGLFLIYALIVFKPFKGLK